MIVAGSTPTGDPEGQVDCVTEADVGEVEKREEDLEMVDSGSRFLRALVECQVSDRVVSSFLAYVNSCSSANNLLSPINFPLDHPVEEVARSQSFLPLLTSC